MQVRLRAAISGTRNGQPWPPSGHTVDLPDAEAVALIRARMAEPVGEQPVETAAVVTVAEKATRSTTPRK
jgi:hypothetical protein